MSSQSNSGNGRATDNKVKVFPEQKVARDDDDDDDLLRFEMRNFRADRNHLDPTHDIDIQWRIQDSAKGAGSFSCPKT